MNDAATAHTYYAEATALRAQSRFGEALTHALQALRLAPSHQEAWELAAYLLLCRKKWGEAAELLQLAVDAFPQSTLLRAHYALALCKTGDVENAQLHAQAALNRQPDLVEALLAQIEIFFDAARYDLALRESLKLADKGIPETAAFCQGAARFLTGDAEGGMMLLAEATKSGWRGPPLPEWKGEPDAHVMLYNNQGFGDLIQFSRYIPSAQTTAARMSLLIPPAMEKLMQDSFPTLPLIVEGDNIAMPDGMTHRCSLMQLAVMEGAFNPLAGGVPYLRADAGLRSAWREKLAHLPRPHIGIVWSSPWQMNSPFRVVDFAALQPLLDVAGPHLVSLQMRPEAENAVAASLFNAAPFITSFADSAALIAELDLVISLDSAPAHLAGALGKPAWIFLPFSAEWRWGAAGESCAWYPSMRLFRQTQPQGWRPVFDAISMALQGYIAGFKP